MHATIRSLASTFVRSPLAWTLAILLPFALSSPAFRSLVVFVAYATIFVTGTVVLVGIALAGLYWIGADIFRGYRGPSLWSMLVAVGEWEGRCAARAIDNVLWLLDRIVPAGPTGPLGIPACPTCPFGECAGCDVVDAPPVLTPALAADIDRVYSILSGRFGGIPTAAVFSPAPSFVALRAPLARLLPSWEEVDASREPARIVWGSTSEPLDYPDRTGAKCYDHSPTTPGGRIVAVAPLPAVLPDAISDPCDETDHPECAAPVSPSSRRWDVSSQAWTAEPEQVTVAACGPIPERSATTPPDYFLPSDATLDSLALSDWPGSETEEAADEKANALSYVDALDAMAVSSPPQIAQDATGTPEPAPEPSSPADASHDDRDLFRPDGRAIGRDRLRKIAKAEGVPYSGGKDGADALVAKIRAHRAYR